MEIWHAIILGLIEGLTEFLPVSSTAHLIIASKILGLKQTEFNTFFEVFIQSGAIVAVALLYIKEIMKKPKLAIKVLISFIPTALIGLVFHTAIKTVLFNSLEIIISMLFLFGVVFIVIEKFIKNNTKKIKHMSIREALVIGLLQSFAIIPGVSRAGIVIIGMLFLKYKKEESVHYSFLLALPTIIAASALDLIKLDFRLLTPPHLFLVSIGTLFSFISAFVCIQWFIRYVKTNPLKIFGIYRIILAISVFIILKRL